MKPLEIQAKCPKCGVGIGQIHKSDCGLERCPFCGIQMIQDKCIYEYFGINVATMQAEHYDIYCNGLPDDMMAKYDEFVRPHLIPWDGVWPGVRECREYGFWSKWVDGTGWVECDANDPEAREDLNKLAMLSKWDKDQKRYIVSQKEEQS